MRRISLFSAALIFLFSISCSTALTSTLADSYPPHETALFSLEGSILSPLQQSQISLKRGNTPVAMEYGFEQIDGVYRLWFICPSTPGNYTFFIKDVPTYENGEYRTVTYQKAFSVTGTPAAYSVNPGAIVSAGDFSVTVRRYGDSPQAIDVDFPQKHSVSLLPGDTIIPFSLDDFAGTHQITLTIGTYAIPALLKGKLPEPTSNTSTTNTTQTNTTAPNQTTTNTTTSNHTTAHRRPYVFEFQPRVIRSTVLITQDRTTYPFALTNTGDEEIPLIVFAYNARLFRVSPREIYALAPNASVHGNITLLNVTEAGLRELIYAYADNDSVPLGIVINLTHNASEQTTHYTGDNMTDNNGRYYCVELNGHQCSSDETCSSTTVATLDVAACCLGSCDVPVSEDSAVGAYIGYGLAGALVAVLAFVYFRYKKTKAPAGNPVLAKASAFGSTAPRGPGMKPI